MLRAPAVAAAGPLQPTESAPGVRDDGPGAAGRQPRGARGDRPRRAGVSAFGFGGTNAHVVLEEPPPVATSEASVPSAIAPVLVLSARDEAGVSELRRAWAERLVTLPAESLADACATAAAGRLHFNWRWAAVADSPERLMTELKTGRPPRKSSGPAEIAWLLTGQGAQYPGLGRELYQTSAAFRRGWDACDERLGEALGDSLDVLWQDTPACTHGWFRRGGRRPVRSRCSMGLRNCGASGASSPAGCWVTAPARWPARRLPRAVAGRRGAAADRAGPAAGRAVRRGDAGRVAGTRATDQPTASGRVRRVAGAGGRQRAASDGRLGPDRGACGVRRALKRRNIAAQRLEVAGAFHSPAVNRAAAGAGPRDGAAGAPAGPDRLAVGRRRRTASAGRFVACGLLVAAVAGVCRLSGGACSRWPIEARRSTWSWALRGPWRTWPGQRWPTARRRSSPASSGAAPRGRRSPRRFRNCIRPV